MGAPKQKWTPEEEAALKAGVLKHGTGKWRTILSDSEFSLILKSRSNVDLKVIQYNMLFGGCDRVFRTNLDSSRHNRTNGEI